MSDKIRQDAMRLLQADPEFREEALRSLSLNDLAKTLHANLREETPKFVSLLYRELLIDYDSGFSKFKIGDKVVPKAFLDRENVLRCECGFTPLHHFDPECPILNHDGSEDAGLDAYFLYQFNWAFYDRDSIAHCVVNDFNRRGMVIFFQHDEVWFLHSQEVLLLSEIPEENRWWERELG